MKKRNLMFALCSATVLGLVGCKDKDKPSDNEQDSKLVTVITQEVINNTFNAMKSDFKLSILGFGEYPYGDGEVVGITSFDKNTITEKHHFDGNTEIVVNSSERENGMVVNTTEYLAAEGQTQEMLDKLDASAIEDEYTKTVDGNIITYSESSTGDTDFVQSINERSHFNYDYMKNKGKYDKYLAFGDIDNGTYAGTVKEICPLLVNKGTYDSKTQLITIDNDDLPANEFTSDYKTLFTLRVVNKIITEFEIFFQEEPDCEPYTENIKLEFGAQTVEMPAEEKIVVTDCQHDGDKSYSYRTYNGKLYEIERCEECYDTILITERAVDENGEYNGNQVKGVYYERIIDHFVAEIDYNLVTKKIISVDVDCCYDNDGYYAYYYWVGETRYTIAYTDVTEVNDVLYASLDFVDSGSVHHFIFLKDVTVDTETYTISGTVMKDYCAGQLLSL